MKLEHNKQSMAYAHPKIQFVYVAFVYMGNILLHKNKTYGRHNKTKAKMQILLSIIGKYDISHITHINYHHPTYLDECGLIKKNDSLPLDIFYKHGGDDNDIYN
jgi:hypothetical protein